ncbi:UDP-N-acetylmuramoyl-L-alanyl-D-glutamate--2,6-diaminopimelate ligase [Salisediminibacterium halotolerans]|uniref:UDP-N-acetylmuramoyl-L-alanyl-D-glutamate--2,6-diaminopimelate ligase n=1 Tax=Salisediminibacterium halotolerans TaxID=517425 RepID=A0A1H9UMI4_9BACI|nr:UDP-N-acetylmuramoyl-L-alanyl-D-glutamate--2,6-diaminopimelate ligase [Salisediminibacterium haloalkalitolerans]SES10572.1 UDP-N-acetylmuramoyl-L-alanyl-D-glutamate--2,6-diaminopimelate ligase [Salisediminibacterium haloalkalitolerans]
MKFWFTEQADFTILALYGPETAEVGKAVYDSRAAEKNAVFFCLKGLNSDGHKFIGQALANGAKVIIGTDESLLLDWYRHSPSCTFIVTDDARKAMSHFSAQLYGHCYRGMKTAAITGTNGKTTVTAFMHYLLNRSGIKTGAVGTEKVWDDQDTRSFPHTTHTTPEAPDLHHIFHTFANEDIGAVVLEVTSIAIDQKRVDGLLFNVGVHTNLTPEHLDFHATFEQYKQSKMQLFQQVEKAVVNLDDDGMGKDLALEFTGEMLTYSLKEAADVTARIVNVSENGTEVDIKACNEHSRICLPIYGAHNLENFLAAFSACLLLGVPYEQLIQHAPGINMPNGRLNVIETGTNFKVISDFAHTPDALVSAIEAARSMQPRRLIMLIAGNGTRDPAQLPLLAAYSEGKADHIVATVEHPDKKDRQAILTDVLAGFTNPEQDTISTALHRDEAIKQALALAEAGDIVLLTGLGPLDHQIIHGQEVPYSELDVIHHCLTELQTSDQAASHK